MNRKLSLQFDICSNLVDHDESPNFIRFRDEVPYLGMRFRQNKPKMVRLYGLWIVCVECTAHALYEGQHVLLSMHHTIYPKQPMQGCP